MGNACKPDGNFGFTIRILQYGEPGVADRKSKLQGDLGIAYDGDADRIGAVDEKGNILFGDELLVLFSRDVLQAQSKSNHHLRG